MYKKAKVLKMLYSPDRTTQIIVDCNVQKNFSWKTHFRFRESDFLCHNKSATVVGRAESDISSVAIRLKVPTNRYPKAKERSLMNNRMQNNRSQK